MKELIKSPITDSTNVEIIDVINSEKIISQYKTKYGIDLAQYFQNNKTISVCECKDSGYQFFYPYVVGDSKFYEYFQQFEWYYIKEKWEYDKAFEIISAGSDVLEIGPGHGYFMKKLRSKNCNIEGIELNEIAVRMLREEGFTIYGQTLETFATENADKKYDYICSFQLMEHITNVGEFFRIFEKLLKPGGILITGVPNSDSVFLDVSINTLNLPPHHAGLWTKKFVNFIPRYFKSLEFKHLYLEPLTFFDQFNAGVFLNKKDSINQNLVFYMKLPFNILKGLFLPALKKSKHMLLVLQKSLK